MLNLKHASAALGLISSLVLVQQVHADLLTHQEFEDTKHALSSYVGCYTYLKKGLLSDVSSSAYPYSAAPASLNVSGDSLVLESGHPAQNKTLGLLRFDGSGSVGFYPYPLDAKSQVDAGWTRYALCQMGQLCKSKDTEIYARRNSWNVSPVTLLGKPVLLSVQAELDKATRLSGWDVRIDSDKMMKGLLEKIQTQIEIEATETELFAHYMIQESGNESSAKDAIINRAIRSLEECRGRLNDYPDNVLTQKTHNYVASRIDALTKLVTPAAVTAPAPSEEEQVIDSPVEEQPTEN
jgi:hypothetical protein